MSWSQEQNWEQRPISIHGISARSLTKSKNGSEVIMPELLQGKLRFMDMIILRNPCARMKVF
jgi:hypothetical protein